MCLAIKKSIFVVNVNMPIYRFLKWLSTFLIFFKKIPHSILYKTVYNVLVQKLIVEIYALCTVRHHNDKFPNVVLSVSLVLAVERVR
jgi:hypothetical protein